MVFIFGMQTRRDFKQLVGNCEQVCPPGPRGFNGTRVRNNESFHLNVKVERIKKSDVFIGTTRTHRTYWTDWRARVSRIPRKRCNEKERETNFLKYILMVQFGLTLFPLLQGLPGPAGTPGAPGVDGNPGVPGLQVWRKKKYFLNIF